jgi:hypothetical protein
VTTACTASKAARQLFPDAPPALLVLKREGHAAAHALNLKRQKTAGDSRAEGYGVSQVSNQMARHFGHQRYRPLRIRFRTSTGDQPHSRHDLATTTGSSISSSSDLPGQEEEPSRPRTLMPLGRQVSRSHALRVAVQVAAVTESSGGACQMSFRGLSCASATSGRRRLADDEIDSVAKIRILGVFCMATGRTIGTRRSLAS